MINFQQELQKIWGLGAHLEIMGEGEQKLCLVEPTLELTEKEPLKVQVQLLEEMEGGEALEAEEDVEALVDMVFLVHLPLNQEQMEATVEREVMEAAAEQGEEEGMLLITLQGQEVQEILVVLEEEAEAVEMLGILRVLVEEKVMAVMAELEAMAEAEGVVVKANIALSALAALVALD